jgi:hypothetical protein
VARFIKLNGIDCEVSKTEAKEAEAIRLALSSAYNNPGYANARFHLWLDDADNENATARREAVGRALKIRGQ